MLPDRYRYVLTLQKTKLNWSTSRLIAKTAEPPKKNRFLLGDYMSTLEPLCISIGKVKKLKNWLELVSVKNGQILLVPTGIATKILLKAAKPTGCSNSMCRNNFQVCCFHWIQVQSRPSTKSVIDKVL